MSKAALLRNIAKAKQLARDNPGWFVREILGQDKTDQWQIDGLEAVADVGRKLRGQPTVVNHDGKNRITVRSCHGTGKTHWLAMVMHWWNWTHYGLGVVTAPKEKQIKTRIFPRYRKILSDSVPEYRQLIEVDQLAVKVMGRLDWGFTGETASDPENMAGFHDEPQIFLVDEASARALDDMFPVIEGALTTPGSVLVTIGNPTRMEGEFYESHNKDRVMSQYHRMHIKPADSRWVSPAWVRQMVDKYGADSPITKIRAFGEFASFDNYYLVHPEHYYEATRRDTATDGSIRRIRISADIADGGADQTVLTAAYVYDTFTHVFKQQGFRFEQHKSPILAADACESWWGALGCSESNGDMIVIDGNGVGSGTVGELQRRGLPVVPYMGGASSPDNSRWRNTRVYCYAMMAESFAAGAIAISEDGIDDTDELLAHILAVKRATGEGKHIDDIVTKNKTKLDNGFSPDRADSLAMLFTTGNLCYTEASIYLVGGSISDSSDW